ncbi:MAG: class I SAM-dependent methyltransferase, partial [Candidatus Binatia bacterium]
MREYDHIGALFYDHYSLGLEGDVQFYVDEARHAGSEVLEIGCGTGRILLPIAQAGVPIVGLDRAPEMFAILRRKLAKCNPETQTRVTLL